VIAPRLLIWSSIPTHHQSAFLRELRATGIDLVVHYYRRVTADRLQMGWQAHDVLPTGERYVPETLASLEQCPDWRDRLHIVPGYGCAFLLKLVWHLCQQEALWLHWSEHSHSSLRSTVTFAVKRVYGELVRRHAMGALAIGELARREFIRWGIPSDMIRFLPYAVEGFPELAGDYPERSAETPQFLFLGTLYPTKGIDILLNAMSRVLDEHPRARLTLIGNDLSRGRYRRQAEQLSISSALNFAGPVEAGSVGMALRRCDVLILSSRHDGWGVVLNEGASVGRALIATTACGAAHHLIEPGVNGFRVEANDARALADAMSEYCRDTELARQHGRESRRLFENFTPARNAQRFLDALQSLRNDVTSSRGREIDSRC